MIIYNNQSGLTDVYLGNTNIAEVYIGDEKVFPTTPSFKWKATYSDSHVESAECDSSSSITKNEIAKANLVSVEIGDCVTSIGNSAFWGCNSLTSVTIGSGVTSIGQSAFVDCSSLTSINIPNGVTTINNWAFQGCTSLSSITIPNSVTSIGNAVLTFCSGLTSVVIPNSVTSIGQSVFKNCSGLTSVTLSSSLTTINYGMFENCINLQSISIPSNTTSINEKAFQNCSSLSNVTIPSGVTNISTFAFEYCSSITGVTIPNSVTNIGMFAFDGCSSLQNLTVEATTPPTLGGDAFNNTNDCPIYVPCQSVEAYKTAWSAYESRIQCIEPTPTGGSEIQITYSAETSPTKLANICSQDVERVSIAGWVVFNHCITTINSALTSGNTAFFEKRTTVVENEEFADTDMISCGVSSEITSIGNGAFSGNTTLSLFNIGAFSYLNPYEQNPISQLTSIGDYAFKDCSNMKTFAPIGCKNSVPTLGTGVFDGCTSLEIIYVPNSMVNAFKTAPGWITFESIIQGI